MAEFRELYSNALIYDAVFDRPVAAETLFMRTLYEKVNGSKPQSFLEVACGPAYHARQMSRDGLSATGFDLEPEMIAFAKKEAEAEGLDTKFFIDDMRTFTIQRSFDVAAAMLDGIDCLLTYEEIEEHLCKMALLMTGGGLYFLDNMHPRDVNVWKYDPVIYEGEKNGLRARISYGLSPPEIDPVKQIATTETLSEVWSGGEYTSEKSTAVERFITPQEIASIASSTRKFELLDVYGDFSETITFDAASAHRMIIVLQKKG